MDISPLDNNSDPEANPDNGNNPDNGAPMDTNDPEMNYMHQDQDEDQHQQHQHDEQHQANTPGSCTSPIQNLDTEMTTETNTSMDPTNSDQQQSQPQQSEQQHPEDADQKHPESSRNTQPINKSNILEAIEEFDSTIPDPIVHHFLNAAGMQTSDKRIIRLIAVAAQKFIHDIVSDSLQHCKLRNTQGKKTKEKRYTLAIDDLSAALGEYGIELRRQHYFN